MARFVVISTSLLRRGPMTPHWISVVQGEFRRENRKKQFSRPHLLAPCPFEPMRRREDLGTLVKINNLVIIFVPRASWGPDHEDQETLGTQDLKSWILRRILFQKL